MLLLSLLTPTSLPFSPNRLPGKKVLLQLQQLSCCAVFLFVFNEMSDVQLKSAC